MANFKLAPIALALALATCEGAAGLACVPLVAYSKAEQKQMKNEMVYVRDKLPMIGRLVDDYTRTRSAIRKCHELRS